MPDIEIQSGDSSGIMIQLNAAPATGIKNFQVFNTETLTPGRCNKPNQMVKAAADKKLNQPKAIKYSGANALTP